MCTTRKNKDAIALLPYLTGKILVFTEFFSKDKFTLLPYQTFMRACTISNTKFDSKYANAPTVLPQYLQILLMRFIATKRQKMTTKSPHFSTQKAPMKFVGSEKTSYCVPSFQRFEVKKQPRGSRGMDFHTYQPRGLANVQTAGCI